MRNGVSLTKGETVAGWIWLPIYLFVLKFALRFCMEKFAWQIGPLTGNLIFFGVNLAAVLLIFHRFLFGTFFGKGFWNFIQALILGAVMLVFGTWLLKLGAEKLLQISIPQYNDDALLPLIGQNRPLMLFICIVAAPVIEETLVRGLVYGSLRKTSRVIAYMLAVVTFAFMHTWQYFGQYPTGSVLLCALGYLPAAAALCWTYERAGSVWAPIVLHALANAVSFGIIAA